MKAFVDAFNFFAGGSEALSRSQPRLASLASFLAAITVCLSRIVSLFWGDVMMALCIGLLSWLLFGFGVPFCNRPMELKSVELIVIPPTK